MQIIILGAGQVGSSLAAHLVTEQHTVTVVDINSTRLAELQTRYDLQTITGHCSHPTVLALAGAASADMIIAVTNNDEANMIACQVAHSLFNIPLKVSRVRTEDYFIRDSMLFRSEHIPIDVFINSEKLVTAGIQSLIENPGSLRVLNFMDGQVKLVATQPKFDSALIGKSVTNIRDYLPEATVQIVGVFRQRKSLPIEEATVFAENDLVFFVAKTSHVKRVIQAFHPSSVTNKRIMIIGGNPIGTHLATALQQHYQVKLVEKNLRHCEQLAQDLPQVTILHDDGSSEDFLRQEDIEYIDVFCAVTNDDEDNIIACLLAKHLGARQVICLVSRQEHINLIESGIIQIDVALSPQQSTVGAILTRIRRGTMANVYSLRHGDAEAMEIIVPSDTTGSQVIGRSLAELALDENIRIGAIVRDHHIFNPEPDTVLQAYDHLIVFVNDKKLIPKLEKLFRGAGSLWQPH